MKHDNVLLGHGGGGRLAREFLDNEIKPRFTHPGISSLGDAAVVAAKEGRLAFTTDGFVVKPLMFPGGDIGKLSICGTVNDLAVSGAIPKYISLAAVFEEGLPMSTVRTILDSIRDTASVAGVEVVCGDTKIVRRGEADGVFLTTAGIGLMDDRVSLDIGRIRPGDKVLVSGTVGDHGAAILCARERLGVRKGVESDCGPVVRLCQELFQLGESLRFMRDPTRGGLLAVATEMITGTSLGILLEEARLPLKDSVRAACELVGMDPLSLASEGRLVAVVDPGVADRAVELMRELPEGRDTAIVGEVLAEQSERVILKTLAGTSRLLLLPDEDPLPRIC